MIIKSLSRANKSFESLYNYLTRDKNSLLNCYNLYSNANDKKELIKEFLENAKYLKNSRGKNYLYHEIISLNPNNLSIKTQENILIDLVNKYISLRAKNHLVFSALHYDKKHLHIHLMISANEIMESKRVRLSKKDFSSIQKQLENYSNSKYPELGVTKHYNKDLKEAKNKKDKLIDILKSLFKIGSKDEFIKKSRELNLEFYIRGKGVGVIYDNKKYRLKTLGLLEEYRELEERFIDKNNYEKVDSNEDKTKIEKRKEQLKEIRDKQDLEANNENRDKSR